MEVDWAVVVGFGGLLVAIIGGAIARDRQLTNMIHKNAEDAHNAVKEGDDVLHERINRTREDVSNGYVRRADLDGHLSRIEQRISEMRQDMKDERRETNARLDAVLAAIRDGKTDK